MRRKKGKIKKQEFQKEKGITKKSIYDIIGITPDIITKDVRIIIIGDYLLEFYNHKGIIDISDTMIKINTKKEIYIIVGENLQICDVSDIQVNITGKITKIEREQ